MYCDALAASNAAVLMAVKTCMSDILSNSLVKTLPFKLNFGKNIMKYKFLNVGYNEAKGALG